MEPLMLVLFLVVIYYTMVVMAWMLGAAAVLGVVAWALSRACREEESQ